LQMARGITIRRISIVLRTDIPYIVPTRCRTGTAPFTTTRTVPTAVMQPPTARTGLPRGQLRTTHTPAPTSAALLLLHHMGVEVLGRLTTLIRERTRPPGRVRARLRSGANPTFRKEINLRTRNIIQQREELSHPRKGRKAAGL